MVTAVGPRPYERRSTPADAAHNAPGAAVTGQSNLPAVRESFGALFTKRVLKEQAPKALRDALRAPEEASNIPGDKLRLLAAKEDKPSIRVGIIGAGASGLYAALILQDLGIDCQVFEADPERIGGRLFTYYFGGAKTSPRNTPEYYQYFDIGAMRIPLLNTMERLLVKESEFDKPSCKLGRHGCLVRYLNQRVKEEQKLHVIRYHFTNDNNLYLYNSKPPVKKAVCVETNGKWVRIENNPPGFGESSGGRVPALFNPDAGVDPWLSAAYKPITDLMAVDPNQGFDELMKFDLYSTRQYLRSFLAESSALSPAGNGPPVAAFQGRYPEEVIDWLETVDSATGLYDCAFSESVIDAYDFSGNDCDWRTFDGGLSRLADAMASLLKTAPLLGHRVNKIAPISNSDLVELTFDGDKPAAAFDHVITTATFGALRNVDTEACQLSYNKRLAMRTLHYDSALKVAITFKTRFWEHPPNECDRIEGGQSSTDLPSRTIVYPSYGIEKYGIPEKQKAKGVLMTCYTWSQDAARMGSLTHEQRVAQCLSDLRQLHGADVIDAQYAGPELTYSFDWYAAPNFCGPFALYGPGQFTKLYADAIAPEVCGRLHFAGEAMSVHHAWIVGALNSAYRTVFEVLKAENMCQKIAQLKEWWGCVDEVDMGQVAIPSINPPGVVLPGNDEENVGDAVGDPPVKAQETASPNGTAREDPLIKPQETATPKEMAVKPRASKSGGKRKATPAASATPAAGVARTGTAKRVRKAPERFS